LDRTKKECDMRLGLDEPTKQLSVLFFEDSV
jgi:hypothetical protein